MADKIPVYSMFPFLEGSAILSDLLEGAEVTEVTVQRATRQMEVELESKKHAAPIELQTMERLLKEEFSLSSATVTHIYTGTAPAGKKADGAKDEAGTILMGRQIKKTPVPIESLTMESGRIAVEGDVFAVSSKEITKREAYVLNFDMTDFTGSVRISKFIKREGAEELVKKLEDTIKPGLHVMVYGLVGFNRYDGDIALDPDSIMITKKPERQDTAEEKRVELHMHTQMSAMDATTKTSAVIARAAKWGHPAIAITDHGVVQSFPDTLKAKKGKNIKILYGIEGYYINDVDDRPAVFGPVSGTLTDEVCVFDIETTGLDATADAITEIGAVIMRGEEELARFQTFADPGMHIPPQVTTLTGIRDEDVAGAPDQREAVRQFLEFAGGRPLAAHNASFDVGFIHRVCERENIDFVPNYIDTLPMAQGLIPDSRNHRLDTIADRLSLPAFDHHRASDDAVTAGLILAKFFGMLEKEGVTRLEEIGELIQTKRNIAAEKRRRRAGHIILIAKNKVGLKNLYRLVTASYLEHFHRYPIMPKSEIMKHREGLIIGAACEAGEVFGLVSDRRSPLEQRRIGAFYDYLEIQPLANNRFMLIGERAKAKDDEDLRNFNRRVIELGRELGKPVCATGDVHFLDPEDEIYRHILLSSKEFDDFDRDNPLYFRSTNEMLEEFSYLGGQTAYEVVIKNPKAVADECEDMSPLPPPDLFPPKIERSAEQLRELVYGRMRELYGENPPECVTQQIEKELVPILERGYDVIYMTAQKLVADSLAHGYLVGSRGSVGSSLVAYMSGITEVNSLPAHYRCPNCCHTDFEAGKGFDCGVDMPDAVCPVCGAQYKKEGFNIPFETFLGFGGDKVPDIDLNFSGEYQANAHRYTTELFGKEHVFRAGTIGTVAEKTAFGYVKKYLDKTGKTVTKAEEGRLALGCVDVKRTTGQHPGGLVVIPQDMEICDFCPAQHPADDPTSDIITTHFEYHCMEANLLKLDELGHDDPTMIKMLEDATGVNAREILLDDPETMRIFSSPEPLGLDDTDPIIGKTGSIGIPEFGTGFTRQMLADTTPDKFSTLVRLSGFSHGTDVWLGNAKDLILSGTATVNETIGCRDDIMLYLISMGMPPKRSFKIMEAVRKGRGLPEGAEEEMKAANVPEWYIESCKKIKYLFPKAHAVAYVTMAFRIAWFKVHEPLAFYSAYFYRRSQKDGFDAAIMVKGIDVVAGKIREISTNPDATAKEQDLLVTLEACYEFYKRGFEFKPIDLYESDATKFLIQDGALRPPFVAVGGLGETAAIDIVEHRKGRQFVSEEEFSAACPKVSKSHIEQLRDLGALRGLPETSQISLF